MPTFFPGITTPADPPSFKAIPLKDGGSAGVVMPGKKVGIQIR